MMNVEVTQVANGWMVRKTANRGMTESYALSEVMVFNCFQSLCEYLRTLSGMTK